MRYVIEQCSFYALFALFVLAGFVVGRQGESMTATASGMAEVG